MKLREVSNGNCYIVLSDREARECGITVVEKSMRGRLVPLIRLPPNAQAARVNYTFDEAVHIGELMLQGARWCEYRRKHFLIVLPWKPLPLPLTRR